MNFYGFLKMCDPVFQIFTPILGFNLGRWIIIIHFIYKALFKTLKDAVQKRNTLKTANQVKRLKSEFIFLDLLYSFQSVSQLFVSLLAHWNARASISQRAQGCIFPQVLRAFKSVYFQLHVWVYLQERASCVQTADALSGDCLGSWRKW